MRRPKKEKRARATIEYNLLTGAPYTLDHKAFSHAVHIAIAAASAKPAPDFEASHAKGQPCRRVVTRGPTAAFGQRRDAPENSR